MIRSPFKKTLFASVLCASMTLSGVAMAEVLKISVAGPHTGAYAAFGEQLWRGAEQAAKDINAAGGINGKTLELVKSDDACEPKQAVAVANRAIDVDKVVGVVGHFCSSSTMPASDIYADADILMVTPASTNPQITERGLPMALRMCGRDDQQGAVAGDYIINKLHAKRVAIIHDKDTYGQGLADATRAHLNKNGLTEVLYEGLTRGEKDFNALVTKIRSLDTDVVYFGGLHSEAGPLVRQMREQGVNAVFISGDGIVSEDFATAAGGNKFVKDVHMTFGADPRKNAAGKSVIEEFRAANYEPEGYTLYSYASVQVIAAALKGSGSTSGEKMGAWLKKNPVETAMGTKAFDAKGDLEVSDYVMYKWDDKGQYAEVE